MRLAAEVIADESRLDGLREEWDALAVAAGRPFCAPAWMLAWWRHARPEGARLRLVAVHEDGRLVGIAPLWVEHDVLRGPRYLLLAGGLSAPVGPLAEAGQEEEVAKAIALALTGADPRPHVLRLDGQASENPVGAPWPDALAAAWPGSRPPWRHSALPVAAPTVALEGFDYEAWLGSKTSNFRQQARRFRRKLEGEGARIALAGPDELERALDAFVDLHGTRWSDRGGSNALVPGLRPMLSEVARELGPAERFRAFTIELEGRIVSAQLLIAAGGEVSYWNGGFDEAFERHKPALQTLLFAIDDGMRRGERRLDLGPGAQDYKQRLADGEYAIDTVTLVPRVATYPLTRLRLARYQARWGLSRRLTPEAKRRARRLLRR